MEINEKLAEQIAEAEARGSFVINKISIDSRTLRQGETFLALRGDNFNGHNFIEDAIKAGCNAIILEEDYFKNHVEAWLKVAFDNKFYNFLIVKNSHEALVKLAKYIRDNFKGRVIGITGSVGKTTTKELLKTVLQKQTKVSVNFGNLNNHIGLPLSICNMDKKADVAIFEMGMSSKGEISFLTKILKPDIAIITDVSEAHSGFFNTIKDIALAKAEILEGLNRETGILFLNKDSEYYSLLREQAKGYQNIYTFSLEDIYANSYSSSYEIAFNSIEDYGIKVLASVFNQDVEYRIKSLAKHHILLGNLVLAIAFKLDLSLIGAAKSIEDFELDSGRGKISAITLKNNKKALLIDDSYNASPKSMIKALEALMHINRNKILVLGDMLELGENAVAEHLKLLKIIEEVGPKNIFFVGKNMCIMGEKYLERMKNNNKEEQVNSVNFINNILDVPNAISATIEEGEIIFIKGSYGTKVHLIAKELQEQEK